MKRLGMLVVLLVWIMLFMIPCMSLASSGESTVAPAYLYTRNVKATLTISENVMGRPDSSVPSCTVTGKFGAG